MFRSIKIDFLFQKNISMCLTVMYVKKYTCLLFWFDNYPEPSKSEDACARLFIAKDKNAERLIWDIFNPAHWIHRKLLGKMEQGDGSAGHPSGHVVSRLAVRWEQRTRILFFFSFLSRSATAVKDAYSRRSLVSPLRGNVRSSRGVRVGDKRGGVCTYVIAMFRATRRNRRLCP